MPKIVSAHTADPSLLKSLVFYKTMIQGMAKSLEAGSNPSYDERTFTEQFETNARKPAEYMLDLAGKDVIILFDAQTEPAEDVDIRLPEVHLTLMRNDKKDGVRFVFSDAEQAGHADISVTFDEILTQIESTKSMKKNMAGNEKLLSAMSLDLAFINVLTSADKNIYINGQRQDMTALNNWIFGAVMGVALEYKTKATLMASAEKPASFRN